MTNARYGWIGKILKVDLTTGAVEHLDTRTYSDLFLGGRGAATRIYWEAVGPEIKAFDPQNHLIFMTGLLGATGAQAASRTAVVGKSPMTNPEGFCYGNIGGFFGPFLKKAGYDGLVVTGRADNPVYLSIEDDKIELVDATHLWGRGAYETAECLKNRHSRLARFVTTGVAGENLCRNATLFTDNEGSVTGGWGAVMGGKKLKAIVVTGTGGPEVAHSEKLLELNKLVVHLNRRQAWSPFPEDQVRRVGRASCFQCGLDCIMRSTYETASGKSMIRKCQSMFVYYLWVMRRQESAETALEATGICNDLSLCTMEMANIIQWLDNCQQAGILASLDTGLDMSQIGTLAFFRRLAEMIAQRQGFGEILAEGLLRAGERLGPKAVAQFPHEVSDVGDGATYSAREYMMNGLLYAFEPRQPIAMLHEISRIIGQWVQHLQHPQASPVTADVFRAAAEKFWGHEKAWDLNTTEGKAAAAVMIMDRTYAKDSLGLCDSVWLLMVSWNTPDNVGDPGLESQVFRAVTGLDIDEAGLRRVGERIFNLQRLILLREGRRPLDDDILEEFNFQDPVQSVFMNPEVLAPGPGEEVLSRKGKTLSHNQFEQMRMEFYNLRGWDPECGLQKMDTLRALRLDDVISDLGKGGLNAADFVAGR